jgi:hypothetical protein
MRDVAAGTPQQYIVDQLEAIQQQLTSLTTAQSRASLSPISPGLPMQYTLRFEGTKERQEQFIAALVVTPGVLAVRQSSTGNVDIDVDLPPGSAEKIIAQAAADAGIRVYVTSKVTIIR